MGFQTGKVLDTLNYMGAQNGVEAHPGFSSKTGSVHWTCWGKLLLEMIRQGMVVGQGKIWRWRCGGLY